ncbi:diguanylate cyclase domain-containing protein [Candidatus Uabimicrobium sp. HlEnr_7]|uniref:diguanylate cyclase domain-containing protein n=1 Tax=Candidatus Uabimicrobium helgolandensis TaxID=3095367 RepID=UPI003558BF57
MLANTNHKQLAQKIFEATSCAIMVTNSSGNIVAINQAFTNVTGYSRDEIIGKNPRIFQSGKQSREFYKNLWINLLEKGSWQGEFWNRRKNGEIYLQWANISAIEDEKNIHYVAIFSDITTVKSEENKLRKMAYYDPLTKLPNRLLLEERLNHALAISARHENLVAVLFLDLDNFKPINDCLGHDVGDKFLQEVAKKIKHCVRKNDTVARLGGDEFVVILEDVKEVHNCETVANKIIMAVSNIAIADTSLRGGVSIGISIAPIDGCDCENLLTKADSAMYKAKRSGKNNYMIYQRDKTKRIRHLGFQKPERRNNLL